MELLTQADPNGEHNIIRLLNTFEERGHVCLVFESMDMNLRQLLKKFGRDVGVHVDAVRIMGYKILKALTLMRRAELIHADLKPDNILVDAELKHVKVADLGSAFSSALPACPCALLTCALVPTMILRQHRCSCRATTAHRRLCSGISTRTRSTCSPLAVLCTNSPLASP